MLPKPSVSGQCRAWRNLLRSVTNICPPHPQLLHTLGSLAAALEPHVCAVQANMVGLHLGTRQENSGLFFENCFALRRAEAEHPSPWAADIRDALLPSRGFSLPIPPASPCALLEMESDRLGKGFLVGPPDQSGSIASSMTQGSWRWKQGPGDQLRAGATRLGLRVTEAQSPGSSGRHVWQEQRTSQQRIVQPGLHHGRCGELFLPGCQPACPYHGAQGPPA